MNWILLCLWLIIWDLKWNCLINEFIEERCMGYDFSQMWFVFFTKYFKIFSTKINITSYHTHWRDGFELKKNLWIKIIRVGLLKYSKLKANIGQRRFIKKNSCVRKGLWKIYWKSLQKFFMTDLFWASKKVRGRKAQI